MPVRTYRAIVTGQFARPLPDEVKAKLVAELDDHDFTTAAFTPQGTFIYASALTRFTFRVLLEIDEPTAVDADEAAAVEAELRAQDYLDERGIPARDLTVSLTCLDDVKVRAKRT